MKENKRLSFRFSTPQQVRKSISRINNMVANGEMDSKRANTIIVGANAILGAIRLDEQQKQIERLEELVNQRVIRKELERKEAQRSKFWASVSTELLKRCLSDHEEEQEKAFKELQELHSIYCKKNDIKGSLFY